MTRKCLFAYTPTEYPNQTYPPYVNLSREEDGTVTMTVRSASVIGETGHPVCGDSASITLDADTARLLLVEAQAALNEAP